MKVVSMKRSEVDMNKVTPAMEQDVVLKEQNEDVIIFFRLGDFYEMFFEDAIQISRELELTLTSKNAGLEEKIPMCGIPHHAANVYIEKLVEKGYKVGIVEQLEDAKKVKGIVKRDIIQIISKGTMMDYEFLKEYENNYIGNILDFQHAYTISYTDITTGELFVTMVEHNISTLISQVVSFGLKEVIVSSKVDKTILSILKNQFKITVTVTDEVEKEGYQSIYQELNDVRYIETIQHLLTYITHTQKRSLAHLMKPIILEHKNYLKMRL